MVNVGTVHIDVVTVNIDVYDPLMPAETAVLKGLSAKQTSPKPYHHGDLHREILCAARDLLEENNIASMSLRAVAKKVGVSHAAPYRHFKDKESLLAGIAGEGFKEMTTQLAEAVNLHPGDPGSQLQEAGRRYAKLVAENPQCVQLMFGGILPCDDTYPELRESGDMAFTALKTIIEDGQSLGVFRKGDVELMALTAWSGIHGLSLLLISGSIDNTVAAPVEAQSLTTAVTTMLLDGLKAG